MCDWWLTRPLSKVNIPTSLPWCIWLRLMIGFAWFFTQIPAKALPLISLSSYVPCNSSNLVLALIRSELLRESFSSKRKTKGEILMVICAYYIYLKRKFKLIYFIIDRLIDWIFAWFHIQHLFLYGYNEILRWKKNRTISCKENNSGEEM